LENTEKLEQKFIDEQNETEEIVFRQDFMDRKVQNQNKLPAVSLYYADERNGNSKIAVIRNGFMIEIEAECEYEYEPEVVWRVRGDGSS
jgi:hypothetical protein